MHDNFELIMKKYISKIALGSFIALSICCFSYLNKIDSTEVEQEYKYEQLSQTKDKMVTGFKSATLVFGQVVDFLTKRDVG